MKYLITLLTVVLIASCSPARRMGRLVEKHPELLTENVDTFFDVKVDSFTEYKDTTIYLRYRMPADTVIDSIPYPVYVGSDGLVNSDSLFLETDLAKAYAVVVNSILKGELVQKDTVLALEFLLEDAMTTITIQRDSIITINRETKVTVQKARKKMFLLYAIIGFLVFIIIGLIIKR